MRRHLDDERGFTVIEAGVAMLILAFIVIALSQALIAGLRAAREARTTQQATAIAEELIEDTRNVNYDTLAMTQSDLAGDLRILSGDRIDPDGSGPLEPEPLVTVDSGGTVSPHRTIATRGGTTFTVWRYVSWVDDDDQGGMGQDYKRFLTVVEWTVGGRTYDSDSSTFVARARRGLPAPKFELAPLTQSHTVLPGNVVTFAHTVSNYGISDTYDITVTIPPGRSWVISLYQDTDQDGVLDPGFDPLLVDNNDTGIPDTGSVFTNATVHLLAVWVLSPTESPGITEVQFTATSGIDENVSQSAIDTLVIGDPNALLHLHNVPTPPVGDTNAQRPMGMDASAPTATTVYKYSTNYYTAKPGRYLEEVVPNAAENTERVMGNWVFHIPRETVYAGNAVVRLYVAAKGFACNKVVNVKVWIRKKNSPNTPTGTTLGEGTGLMTPTALSAECPFQLVVVTVPLNVTMNQNDILELKIQTESVGSTDHALFAYDTTTYDAQIQLPQVAA